MNVFAGLPKKIIGLTILLTVLIPAIVLSAKKAPRILIFTKMKGYVHKTLPGKLTNLKEVLLQHHFIVDDTDDASIFNDDSLKRYSAIIFLDCSGNLFDESQKTAFVNYMKSGGGWIGIHAAPIAEKEWDWYDKLIGTRFAGHPWVQEATLTLTDPKHPITKHLPASWKRSDEWYFWTKPLEDVHVLINVSETRWHGEGIVETGTKAGPVPDINSEKAIVAAHPIAWCHDYAGGRAFYTSMGHFEDAMKEPEMQMLIVNAINWAAKIEVKN